MRAILITLLLAAATPARAADPVRLAVLLVVDQMRWDYPERAPEHGFGRFLREGTYYANARHAHVPTYTGVGHASLATGSYPSEHGILGNDFYDPAAKKTLYCVEDESGAKGPFRLKVATLGDRLKEANAGAKVVSISGKDRAAIFMGGRKADLALWYDKKSGRFVTSGYYGKPPSWVEAFNDEKKRPAPAFCAVPPSRVVVPVMPGVSASRIAARSSAAACDRVIARRMPMPVSAMPIRIELLFL